MCGWSPASRRRLACRDGAKLVKHWSNSCQSLIGSGYSIQHRRMRASVRNNGKHTFSLKPHGLSRQPPQHGGGGDCLAKVSDGEALVLRRGPRLRTNPTQTHKWAAAVSWCKESVCHPTIPLSHSPLQYRRVSVKDTFPNYRPNYRGRSIPRPR